MFTGWLYLGILLSQQCHIACHGAGDISEAIARHITVGGIASASITSRMNIMGVYCLPCIILVSALSSAVLSEEENLMVQSVIRRLSGDIYFITVSNSESTFDGCFDGGNLTFLVSERRCVNNEEFFNNCNFTIEEESSTPRLALIIIYQNDTEMITAATIFNIDTSDLTDAVVYHRPTGQPVRSAFCHISSLEVYRGRNEAINIRHDGFHLNQRGAIEINPSLDYSIDEYTGELYRMNLSCNNSGGGLPESGCLFFKVIGTTNILYAKFNATVPGTQGTKSNNMPPTTTSTPPTTNSTPSNSSTLPPIATDFVDNTSDSTNAILVIIVPLVGGVTILISTVMVCVMVLLRNGQKNSISTMVTRPQNRESDGMKSQPSDCQRNPAYGHFSPTDSAQPSAPQEPTYEVIPSETDRIPQGAQNVNCSQNPAYIHLGVRVEESFQAAADAMSPGDYVYGQNPAYGINSLKS